MEKGRDRKGKKEFGIGEGRGGKGRT